LLENFIHHVSDKHMRRYLDELTFRLDTKDLIAFDPKHMEGHRLTYQALIE